MEKSICSKSFEVEIIARKAQVGDDISDDSAWDISRMPGKRNQSLRMERIRIVSMTAAGPLKGATYFLQAPLQVTTAQGRIFSHFMRRGRICRERLAGWGVQFPLAPPNELWPPPGNSKWLRSALCREHGIQEGSRISRSRHRVHPCEAGFWKWELSCFGS
jgi:hypothetical protein